MQNMAISIKNYLSFDYCESSLFTKEKGLLYNERNIIIHYTCKENQSQQNDIDVKKENSHAQMGLINLGYA